MADKFRKVVSEKPFTILDNAALRDSKLSLKARGLLCTCMSLPPDWSFSIRGLASLCREGRDAIATALNELEAAGYLRRNRIQGRTEAGTFGGTEYVFYEAPVGDFKSPWPENPATDEPATGQPYTGNPPLQNKEQLNKDKHNPPISPKAEKPPMPAELIARVEHYAGEDLQLRDALLDFARMRDARKKTIKTDRQLTLLLSKLNELSGGRRRDKIALIEKATVNGWLSFYPLHEDDLPASIPPDGRSVSHTEVAQW